jgi:hypothetical protein
MEKLDTTELWRRVPPEEKLELMARAHSTGVFAVLNAVLICGTIAVGLQLPLIMWSSLLLSPFVFQYAAGKTWRGLRPRVMLDYLAARSAARRFAFSLQGQDLAVLFMFKGHLRRLYKEHQRTQMLEDTVSNAREASVWVTLFGDSIVFMSEGNFGAELEFGHLINDKIELKGRSPDGQSEYSNERELIFTARDRKLGGEYSVSLTSKYPAALVVFEKKFQQQKDALSSARKNYIEELAAIPDDKGDGDDDLFGSGLIGM